MSKMTRQGVKDLNNLPSAKREVRRLDLPTEQWEELQFGKKDEDKDDRHKTRRRIRKERKQSENVQRIYSGEALDEDDS